MRSHVCFGLSLTTSETVIISNQCLLIDYLVVVEWGIHLVESDGSDSDSEMSIISEGESDEEDHDRVTVDTDSFEGVCEQLGGNVTENVISFQLSVIEVEFHQNIRVDVCYNIAKFQLHMMCLC